MANSGTTSALTCLSTSDIITKVVEYGIEVTELEARKFRYNDVDGEAISYGLTETMVAYLFEDDLQTSFLFLGRTSPPLVHTQRFLKRQYLKAQSDSCIVTNAMTKTFQWRRKEVAEGVRADTIANKYPFLKTPAGLCEEMNRIHNIENLQHRFREEFLPILPKVLALAKGKSPLEKIYLQAREESLSEDLPAMDFKAGLVLLPIIFKEKVEHHVTLEEPGTPYPTTQLTHTDWKSAFTRRGPSVVKTDGFELCRASDLEEGVIAAFCAYFVFNMAYPPNRKNTLTFVQRCILKISEEGDKPLSATVIRILNQLY
ncbi:hypothetical protein JOQ06_002720 [Pogonophryne albipinna]|uniref:Uncharacterized protein n=1 Tax=Pogonophryne albipinna TaxID=1090488 RepID=A0AAD6B8B6_9TELE|nr:hypothetical protein JOQ06_002720 [Pogonophryne albipinna]